VGDNNDALVEKATDNNLLTGEIPYIKDVLIGSSQKSNIFIADSVKQSPFHLSNIVEGNDVFLHDLLDASNKNRNHESISNENSNPELESNPQVIKQSQERMLHFECDDECLITPRLKKYSLNVDSRKRKHHEQGFTIHNL
jgi:hypothetical protein